MTLTFISYLPLELCDLLLERRNLLHELPLATHVAPGFVKRLACLSGRVELSLRTQGKLGPNSACTLHLQSIMFRSA